MKKLIFLLMVLTALTVIFASCTDPKVTSGTDVTTGSPDVSSADDTSVTNEVSTAVTTEPAPAVTTDELGFSSADLVEPGYTENGFTYDIFKSGAKLLSYSGDATELTVPATIKSGSVKVIAIGSRAFKDLDKLASVVISSGIQTLGNDVFYQCFDLTDVSIPSTVTKLGDGIFRYCSSLEEITIPDSVVSMGSDIFFHSLNRFECLIFLF